MNALKDKTCTLHNITDGLPFENKIEPVANNGHPYHLGANTMTEMEPEREIHGEDVARVTHGRHEVKEVVVFPAAALEVLYN